MSRREQIEAVLAQAHADRDALLERASPDLRASLPVDATGVTQGIAVLAATLGVGDELRAMAARGHQANPAVLHGRVFGRAPLSAATVEAAFAEGARVRDGQLARLAEAIDGGALRDEVRALLDAAPAGLEATYDAQERALLLLADRLDELE